jgi:biopolymer transport protein ExbD
MKLPRRQLLVDPPSSASSDIAFILIIFFLVCASVQPETGVAQDLPRTEEKQDTRDQSRNLEVSITPGSIVLNGDPLQFPEFSERLAAALSGKDREADRVVVLKSAPDTPYDRWIDVSQAVTRAGGVITLQLESEKTVTFE